MTIDEIGAVCYVGAGTMGCYNSIVAAISGYTVVLYDVDAKTLEQVPGKHTEMAAVLVANGYCLPEAVVGALQRVTLVPDLERAVSSVDLVSESVFERLDLKRDIHRKLDQICPSRTILTTNSSALMVSQIEDVVGRGNRFAALHSHLGSPLVDIVAGPRTNPATVDILRRYVLSMNGVPLVLKKEHPGYVLNAMLGALLTAGLMLVTAGIAGPENVDRAWMRNRSAPMGPFGMMDLFGLNLIHDTWQFRAATAPFPALRPRVLEFLQPYIDSGKLGMKSGAGFYLYPGPAYQQADFLGGAEESGSIHDTLIAALVGNAVLIAARGVAEPEDIDRAWMVGTYLETGPFQILQQIGEERFQGILASQVAAGRFDDTNARVVREYLRARKAAGKTAMPSRLGHKF
jgi:3-hydroxybutyryl-CoA dehydrogenase